jgi:hypothetical protein
MLNLILLAIATEATTNIITKSTMFEPLRKWIFEKREKKVFRFVNNLIDCPYCTSVWVAMLLFCLYGLIPFFSMILMVLAIHRFSNIIHHIIDRLDSNRIDLEKVFEKEE